MRRPLLRTDKGRKGIDVLSAAAEATVNGPKTNSKPSCLRLRYVCTQGWCTAATTRRASEQ